MASIQDKIGWSDETEVLCKVACILTVGLLKNKNTTWEDFLPRNYQDTAKYSEVVNHSPEQEAALAAGIRSAFAGVAMM